VWNSPDQFHHTNHPFTHLHLLSSSLYTAHLFRSRLFQAQSQNPLSANLVLLHLVHCHSVDGATIFPSCKDQLTRETSTASLNMDQSHKTQHVGQPRKQIHSCKQSYNISTLKTISFSKYSTWRLLTLIQHNVIQLTFLINITLLTYLQVTMF